MKTLTICSSADFYEQAIVLQTELESHGLKVLLPATAVKMRETGNFDVNHYKTWFDNAADYGKKTDLMSGHFTEIEKGDAILVLNNTKRNISNYIGGNVLMEMAVAFYLEKPIFIYNDLPKESAYLEEIIGLNPIILGGNIEKLISHFA